MLRLISVAFALVVFGSISALADGSRYSDPDARFVLTVPAGWQAARPVDNKIALLLASPQGAACVVLVEAVPETKSLTQADLDASLPLIFTKDYWLAQYQLVGLKDVVIESWGAKDQGGRKIYYAVSTSTYDNGKESMAGKTKQVVYAIPGSLQIVTCLAKVEAYAQISPDFESIYDSYQPQNGQYIARAPQSVPSVLALYSGPRFDGETRVVVQDTPDLPTVGWRGATASVAVQGYGQWQVCEGLHYAGNCRLVAAATAGRAGMRVGSVRRYLNPHDLNGAIGLIGAGEQLKAAAAHAKH